MTWITVSAALVLLMIPGVGFFYSGLARRKSALELLLLSMLSVGVIAFQWFFWGYSLTFSRTGNSFFGALDHFGLMKTMGHIQPFAIIIDCAVWFLCSPYIAQSIKGWYCFEAESFERH